MLAGCDCEGALGLAEAVLTGPVEVLLLATCQLAKNNVYMGMEEDGSH